MDSLKSIEIGDIKVRFEPVNDKDYICLTDIARKFNDKPSNLIVSWLKNNRTLLYIEAWEKAFNPDFKLQQMVEFKLDSMDNGKSLSIKKFIEGTNAIGLISKSGKYGGTYAHKNIALNFSFWLSPEFHVLMDIKFQELLEQDFKQRKLKWHISKLTDNVEEMRNLLDTIPLQDPNRNRLSD